MERTLLYLLVYTCHTHEACTHLSNPIKYSFIASWCIVPLIASRILTVNSKNSSIKFLTIADDNDISSLFISKTMTRLESQALSITSFSKENRSFMRQPIRLTTQLRR